MLIFAVFTTILNPCQCLAVPSVHFGAAPQWVVPIKPFGGQPDLREVNDGYYLTLYDRQLNAEKEAEYTHIIYRVISDAGVQEASTFSVDFDPSYEQVTIHAITVWRDGKPLERLEKNAFKIVATEKELSRFMYKGEYTAYLILKDIRAGDELEYAYTTSGSNPILEKKFSTGVGFEADNPISCIYTSILVSPGRNLNFKYFNNAPKPAVTTGNGLTRYEWLLKDVKGRTGNRQSPSWYDPAPLTQVSEYQNWAEVASWGLRINPPGVQLAGTLHQRVAELKYRYGADSAGLLRALTAIVQDEVRYMGVEIGSYSMQAHRPEKVYEQRYGDCKDKALLLVSMLHEAGIMAEVALVNTRKKIADRLPSPSAFDHAIVLAHLNGKDIWIDATISNQGGKGTDIYCPDYYYALILTPGVNGLKSMPDMQGGKIDNKEIYEVKNNEAPVLLTISTVYSGYQADIMRSTFTGDSKLAIEKSYLDYYSKRYPHIERTDTLIVNDDKKGNSLETIERYSIKEFFEIDSVHHSYTGDFYAGMIGDILPAVPSKKDAPLEVKYPYDIRCSVLVAHAIRWNMRDDSQSIVRDAYRFSFRVHAEGDTLSLLYRFTFLKDHIESADLVQYQNDRKKIINDYLNYSYVHTPGEYSSGNKLNYWAIAMYLLVATASSFAGIRIYKTPTENRIFAFGKPTPLGGWIILPMIGLIVIILRIPYDQLTGGMFKNAIWQSYDYTPKETSFKILMWSEFIVNTFFVCYAAFCLLLLVKRRDILPRYITWLYGMNVAFIMVDAICVHTLLSSGSSNNNELLRSLIGACIWIPYFNRADRVKTTFIVPYPEDQ